MEIPIDQIIFDDKARQRKELTDIEGLASSIKRIGLLHPIVIDREHRLLAGRRRLEAYRKLGHTSIPVRFYESLDPSEQRLVELDENLRRVDISWQDRAEAVLVLFELRGGTREDSADYIGMAANTFGRYVDVGKALRAGDPRILACTSVNQAAELLHRRRVLEFQTQLAKLGEDDVEHEPGDSHEAGEGSSGPRPVDLALAVGGGETDSPSDLHGSTLPAKRTAIPPYAIIQGDFFEFAKSYRGPKFNFLHVDFPYGIDFDSSDAARVEGHESGYEDSEELFWQLTSALIHADNIISPSAHMIFWFHMRYYDELLTTLDDGGWWVHNLPLVWHKSDGMGIASDFRRRPKHVYETALWCSKGDRPIAKLVNDVVSAPIAKQAEGHVSAKPEAVLRHFMSMGVNDLSSVFDPTCGSGTSIRGAVALGAERALGLELNKEIADMAALKLKKALDQ